MPVPGRAAERPEPIRLVSCPISSIVVAGQVFSSEDGLAIRPPGVFCSGGRMVENAPILSCRHAGLTIEGYSRAAVQSNWRIPELKIGFERRRSAQQASF